MEKSLKILVFDLDGVITETAKLHYLAWKELVKQLNVDLTEEINEKIKGLPRKDTLLKILEIFNLKNVDEAIINKICEDKNKYYLELLNSNLNEKDILNGIKQLLIDAKNDGIKLAIASSSLNAKMILEKLNIINYFDYIVDPKKIKNGKPFPDIYLDAVYHFGFNPENAIGFEDAPIGIQGLNDAKIFSVGINANDNYVKSYSKLHLNKTDEIDYKIIKEKFYSN